MALLVGASLFVIDQHLTEQVPRAIPMVDAAPLPATPTTLEIPWASTTTVDPEQFAMPADGALTAMSLVPDIEVFISPDDTQPAIHRLVSPTQFGGPRMFLALDRSPGWVHVLLPVRPNGSTGWVREADVVLDQTNYRAEVNLTAATVTVWNGDELVVETTAAHGTDATPTPVGRFYVRDIIPKQYSGGAYGPYIIALSGYSEVLETFGGGLPALAIHGTNRPDQLGSQASSGCVRILNEHVELLANTVPLGTPVDIVA